MLTDTRIHSAQRLEPMIFILRIHLMKLNELLQKIVFECACTVRINFCTFMYHGVLVGSNGARSVILVLGSTVLCANKRTFHAILFAGDAVEGLGEGVAGGVVLVTAGTAGDVSPGTVVIAVDGVAAYAKLGGGALACAIHSEIHFAASRRGERNTITAKVIASTRGKGFLCVYVYIEEKKGYGNEKNGNNTLHG